MALAGDARPRRRWAAPSPISSIAQAPLNTAAGAVSLGHSTDFASKLKMCEGAPATKLSRGPLALRADDGDPGPLDPRLAPAQPDATDARVSRRQQGHRPAGRRPGRGGPDDAAIKAALTIGAPPTEEFGDLPLVELPTDGPPGGPCRLPVRGRRLARHRQDDRRDPPEGGRCGRRRRFAALFLEHQGAGGHRHRTSTASSPTIPSCGAPSASPLSAIRSAPTSSRSPGEIQSAGRSRGSICSPCSASSRRLTSRSRSRAGSASRRPPTSTSSPICRLAGRQDDVLLRP